VAQVSIEEMTPLLVCPRCRTSLVCEQVGYRCTSDSCPYRQKGSFPLLGRWPLLLDIERSIQKPDRLAVAGTEPAAAMADSSIVTRLGTAARSRLRPLVRPPNHVAQRNVAHMLRLLDSGSPLILVVGGGTVGNGAEALYHDARARLIGFDIQPSPWVQFVADAHQIPLASGSVQAVVTQAVLEHVLDPWQVAREIHRVLANGGLVYAETPFMQQVHAGAYDFTRFTSSGHRYLFRQFDEIRSGPVAGSGTQLLWSVDHVARGLFRSRKAGAAAKILCFWLRYIDALIPPDYATDNASAFFFLGRKSDREVPAADMVSYYRGAQLR
jgi:SAM-dependent methyltransferase